MGIKWAQCVTAGGIYQGGHWGPGWKRPPHNSSVHFKQAIWYLSAVQNRYYLQSNTITVPPLIHRRSDCFYLHFSPESVQFPRSPGPGPDILVTGSCRSLCRETERSHETTVLTKKNSPYSKYIYRLSGEIKLQIRISAWFHLCGLWVSKGASLTLLCLPTASVLGF